MKESQQSEKSVVIKSLVFKFFERIGYNGIAFIVNLVLARKLDRADYGLIAMLTIFISVSQVFVQSGLNTALIQRKDITEKDYSSVFHVSMIIAVLLYIILFISAPLIALLFDMPKLKSLLRVLALVLIPGAFNSIQNARIAREMRFKELMLCTLGSVIISGTVGIIMVYTGFGVWSLVGQQLASRLAICVLLLTIVKWRPKFVLEWDRAEELFTFGGKLMFSSLIDVIFREMQSFFIGIKYNSDTLGSYTRGKQFPDIIINNVNGSIQSVMLPALSKHNGDSEKVKSMMRRSIVTSSFLIFPICMGLAMISQPMIHLVLTDKWLPCVPYLRAYCFVYAFWPIHTANLQALNAQGRSDMFLKLEVIKKTYGLIALLITVFCFHTPLAIVLGQCFTTVLSCFVNASPNKILLNYGYFEQMHDILPSLGISVLMGAAVYSITFLKISSPLMLLLQIVTGITVYFLLAKLFRLECFTYILNMCKKIWKKIKGANTDESVNTKE
ncbi:Membrane protein involved in the export of O-antigen and teichoic acid [Ruminococcus sp. YE71]|uniref:lipopolysaccharide biosynthesis protein n=1 Tax=unclassified Ruminococcus TaxID=2608920 RepID=UPI00088B9679|nr:MULTISPECIES: lipopolysaccharide biosynthesis protein [unclassified Ruminococcus]SDA30699.1 Membrane protein involved in the export of O-antigen and teichoic acid [Ruminococcus sp. YE78]SFW49857.1 Membrane protein involved in the export of O-antigen and teichoic acid [Ruminococcus sp. YE71]